MGNHLDTFDDARSGTDAKQYPTRSQGSSAAITFWPISEPPGA